MVKTPETARIEEGAVRAQRSPKYPHRVKEGNNEQSIVQALGCFLSWALREHRNCHFTAKGTDCPSRPVSKQPTMRRWRSEREKKCYKEQQIHVDDCGSSIRGG